MPLSHYRLKKPLSKVEVRGSCDMTQQLRVNWGGTRQNFLMQASIQNTADLAE